MYRITCVLGVPSVEVQQPVEAVADLLLRAARPAPSHVETAQVGEGFLPLLVPNNNKIPADNILTIYIYNLYLYIQGIYLRYIPV